MLIFLFNRDISDNELFGVLPNLDGLVHLKVLNVRLNQFQGGIPSRWEFLSSLVDLNLSSNRLVGELPNFLGTLKHLERMFSFYF